MKQIASIVTLTALAVLTALGQATPSTQAGSERKEKVTSSWWTDFSISPFGVYVRPNLTDAPQYGAGLDIGYQINRTVSLHVANLTYERNDWRDSAIDETSVLFRADLIRSSKERFVANLIASGDRDWNASDYAFGVGVGAEVRLTKNVSIGADSRIRAWFQREKDLLTRGFVSVRF